MALIIEPMSLYKIFHGDKGASSRILLTYIVASDFKYGMMSSAITAASSAYIKKWAGYQQKLLHDDLARMAKNIAAQYALEADSHLEQDLDDYLGALEGKAYIKDDGIDLFRWVRAGLTAFQNLDEPDQDKAVLDMKEALKNVENASEIQKEIQVTDEVVDKFEELLSESERDGK